jgi:hypothetical protein
VAATVSAKCKTIVTVVTKRRFHDDVLETADNFFDVDTHVWIPDPRPVGKPFGLTVEGLAYMNMEMWLSITELQDSNLNGPKSTISYLRDCICSRGHSHEWLACGTIPKSRIIRVMPFDVKALYRERTTKIIRSLDSTEPCV